jgi:Ser/Thr protein kinase RdoA (MazF antagonist)
MSSASTSPPYAGLTPEVVLDAIDGIGMRSDGGLLTLNSYENRVYRVNLDEAPPVVAKFYRPARWSDAQILEEHAFLAELAQREIPAVAALEVGGTTLHRHAGFRFAVFPSRGGRPPNLEDPAVLEWVGRFLGRIHAAGESAPFRSRPALDIETFGREPRAWLLANAPIPPDLLEAWRSVVDHALVSVATLFERVQGVSALRLHGDCHAGNILWMDSRDDRGEMKGPLFLDFDDARSGPAVQDFWMLLSGDRASMAVQLRDLLEGYEEFREFDRRELHLIEALRTLRLIHYSAWIARRWDDPAFPAAFPWFDTPRYWQDRILELREQIALMDEPALEVR